MRDGGFTSSLSLRGINSRPPDGGRAGRILLYYAHNKKNHWRGSFCCVRDGGFTPTLPLRGINFESFYIMHTTKRTTDVVHSVVCVMGDSNPRPLRCKRSALTSWANHAKQVAKYCFFWWAKEDLNLHGIAPTSPSSLRVYQFHHSPPCFQCVMLIFSRANVFYIHESRNTISHDGPQLAFWFRFWWWLANWLEKSFPHQRHRKLCER